MRKWRSPEVPADDEWAVNHQIVIPKMTLLSQVKVTGVLLVFLCQNQTEHFVCALTIEK